MFDLGGIISFSTSCGVQRPTVQRCILSSHVAAKMRCDLESSLSGKQKQNIPKEAMKGRMEFDEKSVQSCYDVLDGWSPLLDLMTQNR